MINYFQINTLVWKFFKKYLEPVKQDTTDSLDWGKIYKEAENIYYENESQYCKQLIFTQLNELERIYYTNNGIERKGQADERNKKI